jgi:hypothetical protein
MDLSHWDAVWRLTRNEAASLIVGLDPLLDQCISKRQLAKVMLMERLVGEAFDSAYGLAWNAVRGMTEPPSVIAPDIFDFSLNQLPSIELRGSLGDVLRDPANLEIIKPNWDKDYTEHFHRADLHAWIEARGIKSVYRFDGVGNDRLVGDDLDSVSVDSQVAIASDRKGSATAETVRQHKLLAMIAALLDQLHIDPSERGAARRIEEFTEHVGSRVTEETVKKYLDMIPEVIDRDRRRG